MWPTSSAKCLPDPQQQQHLVCTTKILDRHVHVDSNTAISVVEKMEHFRHLRRTSAFKLRYLLDDASCWSSWSMCQGLLAKWLRWKVYESISNKLRTGVSGFIMCRNNNPNRLESSKIFCIKLKRESFFRWFYSVGWFLLRVGSCLNRMRNLSLKGPNQLYSVRGLERSELGGSHGCPGRLWDRFSLPER